MPSLHDVHVGLAILGGMRDGIHAHQNVSINCPEGLCTDCTTGTRPQAAGACSTSAHAVLAATVCQPADAASISAGSDSPSIRSANQG